MEIRFKICDEVFYLNTASGRIEKAEVSGIKVVPTGISRDAEGKSVLEGDVVLYGLEGGPMVTGSEVFASAEECRDWWIEKLSAKVAE